MKQLTLLACATPASTEVLEIQGVEALDSNESEALNRFMRAAYPSFDVTTAFRTCVPEGTGKLLANSLKLLLEPRGIQLRCCA